MSRVSRLEQDHMASTPHNKDSLTLSYIDGPQGSPTPDTDEKAAAQSPERRWSSTSGRHHLVGFLPTAIVVITTLGFVVIIVGFLLGTQYVPEQGGRGFHAAIHHKSFVLNEDKWSRGKSGSEGGHLRVLVISALAVGGLLPRTEPPTDRTCLSRATSSRIQAPF